MKKLVAYFSASGVTRAAARRVAAAAGADIFEIKPAEPYTHADLDWTNRNSRNSVEMNDKSARPAIAGKLPDMTDYDTVFIGYPIWWYVAPRIIEAFLESCNLAGKTVIPFATSGGSGMGRTIEELKPHAPKANWKDGRLLNRCSESEVRSLIEQNDK